jgi:hypothetical protein
MLLPNHSRKRGVVFSCHGFQKFEAAKSQAEIQENGGKRYTLEALSLRTELSATTLVKVLAGDVGVDKRTLSRCFRAFNLVLKPEDYEPQLVSVRTLTTVAPLPVTAG